jgi:hypothetical protein
LESSKAKERKESRHDRITPVFDPQIGPSRELGSSAAAAAASRQDKTEDAFDLILVSVLACRKESFAAICGDLALPDQFAVRKSRIFAGD